MMNFVVKWWAIVTYWVCEMTGKLTDDVDTPELLKHTKMSEVKR